MARGDHQLRIRLPAPVMDAVEKAASQMGRSLNAEIVARLEQTFMLERPGVAPDLARVMRTLGETLTEAVNSRTAFKIEIKPATEQGGEGE